jgi:hypothetical protein
MYLCKDLDHPRNTKQAIPLGLEIHWKRICSDDKNYYKGHFSENNLKVKVKRQGE